MKMNSMSQASAVLMSLLLLPLTGCSASDQEKESAAGTAEEPMRDSVRPARAVFPLSPEGIQTLVAGLGQPWTDEIESVRQDSLVDPKTFRTTYLQARGAIMIETDRAARVVGLQLQSGKGALCGSSGLLAEGLGRLLYGLGSAALYDRDLETLQAAWANGSSSEVRTSTAAIKAGSDGCRYTLQIRAR